MYDKVREDREIKICVVGLGYIGLPTAAVFAQKGCRVVGVDRSEARLQALAAGTLCIEEPGLKELIEAVQENGAFVLSPSPVPADVFIIAVPTPYKKNNLKSCDLTAVLQAVRAIAPHLEQGNTVIVESTIAPKSLEDDIRPVLEAESGFLAGSQIYLAHCPERVMPGRILWELTHNGRIVGGVTQECTLRAAAIYERITEGTVIKTKARTAELTKCVENTFRDVNIALSNELAKICLELDIDCLEVISMANAHPRVEMLRPGPGVGGHCLAVDPYFISAAVPQEARLIREGRAVNESMPEFVTKAVEMLLCRAEKRPPQQYKIAALGASYKGNVGDVRESPALQVIANLKEKGYQVVVCDPHVEDKTYAGLKEAVTDADLAVVLTEHREFIEIDLDFLKAAMRTPVLFDARNVIKAENTNGLTVVNFGNLYQFKNRGNQQ